jgi:anthranilate phosphoribosyltransferase
VFSGRIVHAGAEQRCRIYHERGFTSSTLSQKDFPLQKATLTDLAGADRASNAQIVSAIVHGKDKGPKRDAVLLNASAALLVGGRVKSMTEGWSVAERLIDGGAASEKLDQLRNASK